MLFKHETHIQGRFRFDVYDRSGNLKSTQEVDNFITPTGLLLYPTFLPFAECFRYISFGSGTAQNTILGNGTTGLATPLSGFAYVGGNTEPAGGTNYYELNGCGYREHNSGVSLLRAWRIPSADFFTQNYTFKEVMLTPGRPVGDGTCSDYELSDFISLYPNICSYTKAFTRIIQDIAVQQDDYLIANYELNVTTNTGVNYFKINIDNSSRAEGSDANNWGGYTSGVHSIVHHGVKLIRGEENNFVPFSVEQPYYYTHYGDSFNPALGSPLEPSTSKSSYVFYLSSDDTQFLVSEFSGAAMDTGAYYPYNLLGKHFPSGVEYFHSQPSFETSMGNNIPSWLKNIRKGGGSYFPCADDFKSNCDESNIGLTLKSVQQSNSPTLAYQTYKVADRYRTRTFGVEFAGINASDMINQPVRSLVVGYKSRDGSDVYPFFDLLFASKTEGLLPVLYTGVDVLDYDPSDDFNQLDGINNLTLQFQLKWSSPCSSSVLGC